MSEQFELGFMIDTRPLAAAGAEAAKAAEQVAKLGDAERKLADASGKAAEAQRRANSAMTEGGNATRSFISRLREAISDQEKFGQGAQRLEGFLRGATGGVNNFAAVLGSGGTGGLAGGLSMAGGALSRLLSGLGPVGAGIAAVTAGAVALGAAFSKVVAPLAIAEESFIKFRAQMNLTIKDFERTDQVMEKIKASANETGTSLEAAFTSFNRILRNSEDIGASAEQVLQLNELVQKLGVVSGTSQGEMQGAMIQFSQALAAGRLNGDELRSIMESMPALAKAIADGLGVSVGNLRRMGAEGELTSDKVFAGLLSQTEKINEEFEKMPDTSERATTRMANQWELLKAKIADATGATDLYVGTLALGAAALEKFNKWLEDDTPQQRIAQTTSEIAGLQQRINYLVAQSELLNGRQINLLTARKRALEQELEALRKQVQEGEQKAAAQKAIDEANATEARRRNLMKIADEYDKEFARKKKLADDEKGIREALELTRKKRDELLQKNKEAAEQEVAMIKAVAQAWAAFQLAIARGDAPNAAILFGRASATQAMYDAVRKGRKDREEEIKGLEEDIAKAERALSKMGESSKRAAAQTKSALQSLRESVADLRRAVGEGQGGAVGILTQVFGAERGAKGSGAETQRLLIEQAALQSRAEIENLRRQTEQTKALIAVQGEGARAVRDLTIEQEAMNWAFAKFGNLTGPEATKAIKEYTEALQANRREQERLQAVRRIEDARQAARLSQRLSEAAGNPRAQDEIRFEETLRRDTQGMDPDQAASYEAEKRKERAFELIRLDKERSIEFERQMQFMEDQLGLLTLSTQEYEIQMRLLQARNRLIAEGYDPVKDKVFFDEEMARTEMMERRSQAQENYVSRVRGIVSNFERAADRLGPLFENTFETIYTEGVGKAASVFGTGFKRIIKDIGNQMVYEIAIRPVVELMRNLAAMAAQKLITNLFGGLLGLGGDGAGLGLGASGGMSAANGAWFDGHRHNFQTGGVFTNQIVNQPTMFAFANGIGLMGEAGPEAIMPLKRGTDGRLGVIAERGNGGDNGVTIIVQDMRTNADAAPVETEERRGPNGKRMISIMIRDEVRRSMRSGDLDREMRGNYGNTRVLARK